MKIKLRILCILSAVCVLGSIACFSAVAAELMQVPSADEDVYTGVGEDPVYVDPAPTPAPAPAVDPVVPDPVTPVPEDPVVSYEPDPGYTDNTVYVDPEPDPGYVDPTTTTSEYSSSPSYDDLIGSDNIPQPVYSVPTPSVYVDTTQQYNQFIYNNNQAQYDDNYIYVPQYEAPTESLISTSSKAIDTDELTKDDWKSIMLDLENANDDGDGAKTFNFIKDNEEEGDSNMMWMVYVGTALILAAVVMIVFVIVTTGKENSSSAALA